MDKKLGNRIDSEEALIQAILGEIGNSDPIAKAMGEKSKRDFMENFLREVEEGSVVKINYSRYRGEKNEAIGRIRKYDSDGDVPCGLWIGDTYINYSAIQEFEVIGTSDPSPKNF